MSIGVHPHQAHQFADDPARAATVVKAQVLATQGARAIGEIGLDYHYDFSPRDVQEAVFRAQLTLARKLDQPVVIHTREADEDTLRVLREEGEGKLRGVLHCFTGAQALAEAGLGARLLHFARGHRDVSEGAGTARHCAVACRSTRLLTETDSPFLTPVPHRGKRNEPAHVSRGGRNLGRAAWNVGRQSGRRARPRTFIPCSGRDKVLT